MDPELTAFCKGLTRLKLTETKLAVALMWYRDHHGDEFELTAGQLAEQLHLTALTGIVNPSRLRKNLQRNPDVIRGKGPETFKLRLAQKDALADQLFPLLTRPSPTIDNHILPAEAFTGTRKYLQQLAAQINGCYQFGFFDACMVMSRRLIEVLLIHAFEARSAEAAIKSKGDYMMLSDIIAIARSGQHVKLARGNGDILESIKKLGDTAAHSKTYITTKRDVDDLRHDVRRAVSDLMHLANFAK